MGYSIFLLKFIILARMGLYGSAPLVVELL